MSQSISLELVKFATVDCRKDPVNELIIKQKDVTMPIYTADTSPTIPL